MSFYAGSFLFLWFSRVKIVLLISYWVSFAFREPVVGRVGAAWE